MLVPLTEEKKKKQSPASTHLASQPYCVWELIRMLWAYSTTTEAGCAHGLPLHITGASRVEQRFMCFFADSSCPSHIPWLHDLFPCGIPHYACQWADNVTFSWTITIIMFSALFPISLLSTYTVPRHWNYFLNYWQINPSNRELWKSTTELLAPKWTPPFPGWLTLQTIHKLAPYSLKSKHIL